MIATETLFAIQPPPPPPDVFEVGQFRVWPRESYGFDLDTSLAGRDPTAMEMAAVVACVGAWARKRELAHLDRVALGKTIEADLDGRAQGLTRP